MCAEAGVGPPFEDEEGSADVVAPLAASFLSPLLFLSDLDLSRLSLLTSAEDAPPVFGRLALFWCSESEGERDLLRFESASESPI